MQDIIKRITLQHGWENRPLVLDEIRGSLRVKVLAGGVILFSRYSLDPFVRLLQNAEDSRGMRSHPPLVRAAHGH